MTAFAQTLDEQLNKLGKEFKSAFHRFSSTKTNQGMSRFNLDVDIIEEEKNIIILIDLPGISKKDITLALTDGKLLIEGTRPRSFGDEINFLQQERMEGEFSRTIRLPSEADANSIKAKFTNGVLKVAISKTEMHKPETSIHIE
ncbi:MAG: Hsp20/alpha crystallin family protein [Balneolales bacterium]